MRSLIIPILMVFLHDIRKPSSSDLTTISRSKYIVVFYHSWILLKLMVLRILKHSLTWHEKGFKH